MSTAGQSVVAGIGSCDTNMVALHSIEGRARSISEKTMRPVKLSETSSWQLHTYFPLQILTCLVSFWGDVLQIEVSPSAPDLEKWAPGLSQSSTNILVTVIGSGTVHKPVPITSPLRKTPVRLFLGLLGERLLAFEPGGWSC